MPIAVLMIFGRSRMRVPGFANNGTYRETSLRAVQMIPVLVGSAVEVRQTGERYQNGFHRNVVFSSRTLNVMQGNCGEPVILTLNV